MSKDDCKYYDAPKPAPEPEPEPAPAPAPASAPAPEPEPEPEPSPAPAPTGTTAEPTTDGSVFVQPGLAIFLGALICALTGSVH